MRLAAYLKLSGRTATDLARQCSVSVPTITRVAKGQKTPSLTLAAKIRAATEGAVRADDYLPAFEAPPLQAGAEA